MWNPNHPDVNINISEFSISSDSSGYNKIVPFLKIKYSFGSDKKLNTFSI